MTTPTLTDFIAAARERLASGAPGAEQFEALIDAVQQRPTMRTTRAGVRDTMLAGAWWAMFCGRGGDDATRDA